MNERFRYVRYKHESINASHYLDLTEEWGTLTRKEAALWSLRKWGAIVEFYDGGTGTTISDTGGVTCAFCNKYLLCTNCPIRQVTGGSCGSPLVPWTKYHNATSLGLCDEAREAAVEMVKLLAFIYEDIP